MAGAFHEEGVLKCAQRHLYDASINFGGATFEDPDGKHETVHVDGQSFRRRLPNPKLEEFREASSRPPGARDAVKRLDDLDNKRQRFSREAAKVAKLEEPTLAKAQRSQRNNYRL